MSTRTTTARRRAYNRWYLMILRCTDPTDKGWPWYGGRGITVCDEWLNSFDAYYAAVGDAPAGMSLDRVDNDGNYEPRNVRWATRSEQSLNRRPRSHCPGGHEYTPENTATHGGKRRCRACHRAHQANYLARKAAS